MQFGPRARRLASVRARSSRIAGHVARGADVALQLPTDRTRTAVQGSCNRSQALALLSQARQGDALFGLKLSVSRFRHMRTLPGGKVLHFRFETAKRGTSIFRRY